MTELHRSRFSAFRAQEGRCFYCDYPMWLRSPDELPKEYQYSQGQIARFKCIAEHLVPRRFGGDDGADNIVAACRHCNRAREQSPKWLDPVPYRDRVRKCIARGTWHPCSPQCLKPSASLSPDPTTRRLSARAHWQEPPSH